MGRPRGLRRAFEAILALTSVAACGSERGQDTSGASAGGEPPGAYDPSAGRFVPAGPRPPGVLLPPETSCSVLSFPSPSKTVDPFPKEPATEVFPSDPNRWSRTFECRKDVLGGIRPAVAVDYVSLRAKGNPCGVCSISTPEEIGILCRGSLDSMLCRDRTERLHRNEGFAVASYWNDYTSQFFLATRGDEIATMATEGELHAFLGEIDSGEEAELVVTLRGRFARCLPDPNPTVGNDGWAVGPGGSWDVSVSRCDGRLRRVLFNVTRGGAVTIVGNAVVADAQCGGGGGSSCGRRPDGLVTSDVPEATSTLGRFFAEIAHLEAASVHAFRKLAQDLRWHDAPLELVDRAKKSAREEVTHARMTARLAAKFGGRPERPKIERRDRRSLEAIAIENAVEGCVRETYGALAAMWQARNARDVEVAEAMSAIAEDETRHAELSWAIADFLDARLDEEARARVSSARRAAARDLERELSVEVDDALQTEAGVPSAAQALELFTHLRAELLS